MSNALTFWQRWRTDLDYCCISPCATRPCHALGKVQPRGEVGGKHGSSRPQPRGASHRAGARGFERYFADVLIITTRS